MAEWEQLSTDEKEHNIESFNDIQLSENYGKDARFFKEYRRFMSDKNNFRSIGTPRENPHSPPKRIIVSARENISFVNAVCELIDNSIDKWTQNKARKNLRIEMWFHIDQGIGSYQDNAGGMDKNDLYKVFIPGEGTHDDPSMASIGAFGMGAKKGLFRIADGAKVISSIDGISSYISEIPEKWEDDDGWNVFEGKGGPIPKGETHFFFNKLFDPPHELEILSLIAYIGRIYWPLIQEPKDDVREHLCQQKHRMRVKVNDIEVTGREEIDTAMMQVIGRQLPDPVIKWAMPAGGEPTIYFDSNFEVEHRGKTYPVHYALYIGVTQFPTGKDEERENDYGIDIYGNGRLIEPFVKDRRMCIGRRGIATEAVGVKRIRGQLYLNGNGFIIPWDDTKKDYRGDTKVASHVSGKLFKVIKSYFDLVDLLDRSEWESIRIREFEKKPFDPDEPSLTAEADESGEFQDSLLAKFKFRTPSKPKKKTTIPLSLSNAEFESLRTRFSVTSKSDLAAIVHRCLFRGVAFYLSSAHLSAALKKLPRGSDISLLSKKIKDGFISRITTKSK